MGRLVSGSDKNRRHRLPSMTSTEKVKEIEKEMSRAQKMHLLPGLHASQERWKWSALSARSHCCHEIPAAAGFMRTILHLTAKEAWSQTRRTLSVCLWGRHCVAVGLCGRRTTSKSGIGENGWGHPPPPSGLYNNPPVRTSSQWQAPEGLRASR